MAASATPGKQPQGLLATLGLLVLAGLGWLASQLGWLEQDQKSSAPGSTATLPKESQPASATDSVEGVARATYELGLARVRDAFENQLNGVEIECAGAVVHLLEDDNDGARHQRFLVELENGLTLKIAHNIDLAPRVPVKQGQWVAFRGDYEWNDKGGVIHWTHHDPNGRHPDGWVRLAAKLYQ